MKPWRYCLPLICFLLHGRDYRGAVQARTRTDARAAVKRKLGPKRVPVGAVIEPL